MSYRLYYAKELKLSFEQSKLNDRHISPSTFNEMFIVLAEREQLDYYSWGNENDTFNESTISNFVIQKSYLIKLIQYLQSLTHWYDDDAFEGRIAEEMGSVTPQQIAEALQEALDNTDAESEIVLLHWA